MAAVLFRSGQMAAVKSISVSPLLPRLSRPAFSSRASLSEANSTPSPVQSHNETPEMPSEGSPSLEIDALHGTEEEPRLPRSVQAVYLRPLRRRAQYGVPACDLQLRSYSVRNLEFFADFAIRAAYYLNLPSKGPVPLPRITERWTVPRSNFVNKKSQENFQRITLRRLIQIQDGHPETVEAWLAFLRKHAYYGLGMKANIWEYERLGVGKTMDLSLENIRGTLEPRWAHFGRKRNLETSAKVADFMTGEKFHQTLSGSGLPVGSRK